MGFHAVDYVVFASTLCVSMAIGIYYAVRGAKTRTSSEYMMGDRKLVLLPVAISMIATFTSCVGLLGTPAEIYTHGTQFSMKMFSIILGLGASLFLFVPLFHPLKMTSVFEYLHKRYNSSFLRRICNVSVICNQLIYNGIGILSPALALETVTGMPVWQTIIICGFTAIIYTTIGGMKAVVWSDVFLSLFILAGLLTLVTIGTVHVGGVSRVWELNARWERIVFFNLDPDPTRGMTFWSVVFAFGVFYMCLSVNQACFQRYTAVPTLSQARKAMVVNILGLVVMAVLLSSTGVVAFAYYASLNCDPLAAGIIRNPNQILPYFVMDVMKYPGLPGLFVACLSAAALSTSSSTLNSCATIIWKDFVSEAKCVKDCSEAMKTSIIKVIVVLFGVAAIGMSFLMTLTKGTFIKIVFSLTGCLIGPWVGVFVLGATNTQPGKKAAIIAMFIAVVFNCSLSFGSHYLEHGETSPPSPTFGCHANLRNSTLEAMTYNTTASFVTPVETVFIETVTRTDDMEPSHELPVWKHVFAVSYLYYPGFGILLVVLLGSLLALIPGFEHTDYVPDKLLFPHVRYLRGVINKTGEVNGSVFKRSPFSQLSALNKNKHGDVEYEYEPEIMVTTFVDKKSSSHADSERREPQNGQDSHPELQ